MPYWPCGLYPKWTCLLDCEVSLGVWGHVAGLWRKSNWEGQEGLISNLGAMHELGWLGMGTGVAVYGYRGGWVWVQA